MGDPAGVPQLGGDEPALRVHGVGDLAPAGDLLGAVDAGGVDVPLALGGDLGALADDQAGAGALAVVVDRVPRRHVARLLGALPGERGHEDAVAGRDGTEVQGREEVGHGGPTGAPCRLFRTALVVAAGEDPSGRCAGAHPRGRMGPVTLLSQLRDVPARLRNESRQVPTRDIDEAEVEVESTSHAAAGVTAVAVAMRRAIGQMGLRRTAAHAAPAQPGRRLRLPGLRLARPGRRVTGTPPSSARTAPRRSPRRRPASCSTASSSRPTPWRTSPDAPSTGWASRAGSPSRWSCVPAPPTTRRSRGTTPSPPWPGTCAASTTPTRRSSTPRARPPTRPRSSTSSSCGPSAPTTSPTAPTCATSRPGPRSSTPSASARARSASRTSTRPSCSWSSGRTRAPTTRACSPRSRRRSPDGARIISINPLQEAGLVRFKNPQNAKGLAVGTALADLHLPIRLNGDLALFQAIGSLLVEWDAVDHDFLDEYTTGFDAYAAHVADLDWAKVEASTGPHPGAGHRGGPDVRATRPPRSPAGRWASPSTTTPWAPSRRSSTSPCCRATSASRARACARCAGTPTSRATARWASGSACPTASSTRSATSSASSRPASTGSTPSAPSRRCATARSGCSWGWAATSWAPRPTPRPPRRRCATPRSPSTSPPSSTGRTSCTAGEALILPALGRSEKDLTGGRVQRVTVEDSMSAVHASRGPLDPPSEHLRSEVDIICSLALATLGEDSPVPWAAFRDDYTEIRRRIARVVPGCESYDEKVDEPGGFVLPHPPRDHRVFETPSGRAVLTATPLDVLDVPRGRFLLQTMRSHDQFNTTIYGLDDRYRGVKGGRRVVFVQPRRPPRPGLRRGRRHRPGQRVARRRRAGGAVLPGRPLRPAARVRGGLLPRGQRPRPAGLHGREEQPAGLQVHRGAAGPARGGRPGTGRLARLARPGLGLAPRRPPAPPELSGRTPAPIGCPTSG